MPNSFPDDKDVSVPCGRVLVRFKNSSQITDKMKLRIAVQSKGRLNEDTMELLKEAGQDNSLAELVEDTYQSEKSMKKASYIQQLRGG